MSSLSKTMSTVWEAMMPHCQTLPRVERGNENKLLVVGAHCIWLLPR